MQKSGIPRLLKRALGSADGGAAETREIVFAHDSKVTEVSGLKSVLLQASLAELKNNGYYERYETLIAPHMLEKLLSSLGPGWTPIDVALAHYEACDKLGLSAAEVTALGRRVGERTGDTFLVSLAKKVKDANMDLWTAVGPLQRMWARCFKGGSVQTVKVGPKAMLIEERGFRMTMFEYYRVAHVSVLRSTHESLGPRITEAKIVNYDAKEDELVISLRWL